MLGCMCVLFVGGNLPVLPVDRLMSHFNNQYLSGVEPITQKLVG